jgi:hypothetical protein
MPPARTHQAAAQAWEEPSANLPPVVMPPQDTYTTGTWVKQPPVAATTAAHTPVTSATDTAAVPALVRRRLPVPPPTARRPAAPARAPNPTTALQLDQTQHYQEHSA